MPLATPADREHLHHREINCYGYRRADGLWDIEGHLVDTKDYDIDTPWRGPMAAGEPVHGMWLRITIDDELLIHDCEAVMDDNPYDVCAGAVGSFRRLKGLRIQAGWQGEVRKRVGGRHGAALTRAEPLAASMTVSTAP